jgi:carbon monoxide dehydrogenase subunit G
MLSASARRHPQEMGAKEEQMATIVESIEISRRPEDVFIYATDFSHFPEWQGGVVSARREGDAPLKAVVTRRLGPRKLQRTEEITELNPPRTWTVRGVGGALTAIAKGTVEPLDDGKRSRVTIALELEAHGIARVLAPLILRQVRRQLPRNEQKLKELLERGA